MIYTDQMSSILCASRIRRRHVHPFPLERETRRIDLSHIERFSSRMYVRTEIPSALVRIDRFMRRKNENE